MFHAIHLISSSYDHFNALVYAETPEELIKWFDDNLIDLSYQDQVYVDSQDESKSELFHEALCEAVDAATEAADEEY